MTLYRLTYIINIESGLVLQGMVLMTTSKMVEFLLFVGVQRIDSKPVVQAKKSELECYIVNCVDREKLQAWLKQQQKRKAKVS